MGALYTSAGLIQFEEAAMGKSHRGKAAKGTRGACPVCGRTGVKLMYPLTVNGQANTMVCKQCRNKPAS